MINVNSILPTDDLTGVHNNYIRGFIYDWPQPWYCKSTEAAVHQQTHVPNVTTTHNMGEKILFGILNIK